MQRRFLDVEHCNAGRADDGREEKRRRLPRDEQDTTRVIAVDGF